MYKNVYKYMSPESEDEHEPYDSSITYGPPQTDSEDDYDGFVFSNDRGQRPTLRTIYTDEEHLYRALLNGDLTYVRELMDKLNWDPGNLLEGKYPPLHVACEKAYYDVVEYLLVERKAPVNQWSSSTSPLIKACQCEHYDSEMIEKTIKLLIEHGAHINVLDKYGSTPLMYASIRGYANAVKLLIPESNVNQKDEDGFTALFYAIKGHHVNILQMLIDAGADCASQDPEGFTPTQRALYYGFHDLLEFLPKEKEIYVVPNHYTSYTNFKSHVPRIFPKFEYDCPEYFQEVYGILNAYEMKDFAEYFATNCISLSSFLLMQDEDLEKIGIKLPIHRRKILRMLLHFHVKHWSKNSIARITETSNENFYDIFLIFANFVKHLVIIQSSLKFVQRNLEQKMFGPVSPQQVESLQLVLTKYIKTLKDVRETVTYITSFSSKRSCLYIDKESIGKITTDNPIRRFLKFSLFVSFSVTVCYTIKRFF